MIGLKRIVNRDNISAWKSKGLSQESIGPPTSSNNSLAPLLNFINDKTRVTLEKVVNIYIVYDIYGHLHMVLNLRFLEASLLTKNSDPDKNRYSGYGIGFDTSGIFFGSSGIRTHNHLVCKRTLNQLAKLAK